MSGVWNWSEAGPTAKKGTPSNVVYSARAPEVSHYKTLPHPHHGVPRRPVGQLHTGPGYRQPGPGVQVVRLRRPPQQQPPARFLTLQRHSHSSQPATGIQGITNSDPAPWQTGPGQVTYTIPAMVAGAKNNSKTLPSKAKKGKQRPKSAGNYTDSGNVFTWTASDQDQNSSHSGSSKGSRTGEHRVEAQVYAEVNNNDSHEGLMQFNLGPGNVPHMEALPRPESPNEYSRTIEALPEDAIYAEVVKFKRKDKRKEGKGGKGSQGSRSSSGSGGSGKQPLMIVPPGPYRSLTEFQSGGNYKVATFTDTKHFTDIYL